MPLDQPVPSAISKAPAPEVASTRSRFRSVAVVLAALAVLAATASPVSGASADRSTSPVFTIPPPAPEMVGKSTLVRNDNGISVDLNTSGLRPGDAVTLWWVVANRPEDCEAGLPGLSQCGPMDHLMGRGDMAVHHGTGHVVDDDGTAGFGAHLRVGDQSRALFNNEPGLTNPRGSEVILVLKTHGQKIPGLTSEMLRTFTGGCQISEKVEEELEKLAERGVTPRPEVFGQEGPNTDCAENQFSVHSPS